MDSSSMMEALMQQVDPELAKGEFFFFFFAGGGALSFGITLLPKLLKQFQAVQALKGGISLGGEELGFNLLTSLSYPEPIRVKDIKNILDKMPSIAVLQQKGPKKSFIAKGGYIEREGFEAVFPSKSFNPVAKYAFFDALSSGNGDIASPEACAQAIAKWKGTNGIEAFKSDLTTGLAKKLSAYAVFIFLITLVLDLILESGINGFLTK